MCYVNPDFYSYYPRRHTLPWSYDFWHCLTNQKHNTSKSALVLFIPLGQKTAHFLQLNIYLICFSEIKCHKILDLVTLAYWQCLNKRCLHAWKVKDFFITICKCIIIWHHTNREVNKIVNSLKIRTQNVPNKLWGNISKFRRKNRINAMQQFT